MLVQKRNRRARRKPGKTVRSEALSLRGKQLRCKLQLNRSTGRVLPCVSAEGHPLLSVARNLLLSSVEVAQVTFES